MKNNILLYFNHHYYHSDTYYINIVFKYLEYLLPFGTGKLLIDFS